MKAYRFLAVLMIAVIMVSWISLVADNYPSREFTMLMAYPTGGMPDIGGRVLAPYWEKHLKTKIVIVNKPGASGELGLVEAKNGKPDGYQIVSWIIPVAQGIQATRKTQFSNDNFEFIGTQVTDPHVIVIRNGEKRFSNLKELIQYAKKNPNKLLFAVGAPGGDDDLAIRRFQEEFDIKLRLIYMEKDASVGARTQLMGGYVDGVIDNTMLFEGYVGKGQPLKMIASMWKTRIDTLDPSAPTVEEVTGAKLYCGTFRGYAVRKGLPKKSLTLLQESFKKAMMEPAYIEEVKKRNIPSGYLDPEETRALTMKIKKSAISFFKK